MEFKSYNREESPEESERWLTRLKNLYLENADEKFLTLVADHLDRLVGTPFDDLYDEIADRALCCALRSGELKRIAVAVGVLRSAASERPTARLARAVLHLADGRTREARDHLEGIDGGPVHGDELAEWLAEVVPPLRALSLSGRGDSVGRYAAKMSPEVVGALRTVTLPLRRQLHDYLRLERALWHHYRIPGLAELPQTVGLRSREGRLLWSFFRALKGFRIGIYRPGPRTVRNLERVLAEAQKAQDSTDRGELFDAAEERLRLFQRLLDLERTLGRIEPPVEVTRRRLREFLATNHRLLVRLLPQKPPALFGNLEYAWRCRWFDLLKRFGNSFDSAMWGELYAFRPQVLSYHLAPLNPDLGAHRAMWTLRIDRLLRGEEYSELAQLLAKQSHGESLRPDQLARLWACELWARRRVLGRARPHAARAASWSRPTPRSMYPQSMYPPMLGNDPEAPEARQTLVRLGEMAISLKQRFAGGARPEVARVLRDETLSLTAQRGFSEHLKPLADALLESLPSDLGLLIVGLAAALASGDGKAQRRFVGRFARRKSSAEDLVPLLPLLRTVATTPAEHAVAVLREAKKCLEGAVWNRIEGFLRLEIRQRLLIGLWHAADHPSGEHFGRTATLRRVEQELKDYRSLLGDAMDLVAAEVVVKCWTTSPNTLDRARQFLGRFAALEASVVLFSYVAAVAPREHKSLDRLRELSIETIIARLDLAWQVWKPAIPLLALRCSPSHNDRLCHRIEGLLANGSSTLEETHPLRTALERLRIARDVPRSEGPAEVSLPRWDLDLSHATPFSEDVED